jgi:hypothetical protein
LRTFRWPNDTRNLELCISRPSSTSTRGPARRSEPDSGREAETRSRCQHRGRCRARRFAKGHSERPRQARARDFRALLRQSVRTRKRTIGHAPSRCSPDLLPLRGVPAQPLGSRPPLVCLLPREPEYPKAPLPTSSPHFRVSIRLNLGATPRTGSNPLRVFDLFRSPETLRWLLANQPPPSRRAVRPRPLTGPSGVTRCE